MIQGNGLIARESRNQPNQQQQAAEYQQRRKPICKRYIIIKEWQQREGMAEVTRIDLEMRPNRLETANKHSADAAGELTRGGDKNEDRRGTG